MLLLLKFNGPSAKMLKAALTSEMKLFQLPTVLSNLSVLSTLVIELCAVNHKPD